MDSNITLKVYSTSTVVMVISVLAYIWKVSLFFKVMNAKYIAEQIFLAGVESVLPDKIMHKVFYLKKGTLYISNRSFKLTDFHNIYVIGAGKASALMAKEVETVLGKRIKKGHIIVKHGHSCTLEHIRVTEAGHPTPDEPGFRATSDIIELIQDAAENDLVLCLISGGGSSLLTDYPEGSSPEDLILLNQILLKSGADIQEMNSVRKHVSYIKGGQLARIIFPATLVSLILSDVIGDSLDVIASGPTFPDTSTFENALQVLNKYKLIDKVPASIMRHITLGVQGLIPETPKVGDPVFKKAINLIIGSNKIALQAASQKAVELGYNNTSVVTSELNGDAASAAEQIVQNALQLQNDTTRSKPLCLLYGGETTVQVTGMGLGGRNQHLALCAALLLENTKGITFLSAGTDGNDGPTDVAGAVVNGCTVQEAVSLNIDPRESITGFDSYHFFQQAGGHIRTGSTLTNVMDLLVVLIE